MPILGCVDTWRWPLRAAKCSAVHPSASFTLNAAFLKNKSFVQGGLIGYVRGYFFNVRECIREGIYK